MASVGATDWLDFLENRLSSNSKMLEVLVAIAAVVPAGAIVSLGQVVSSLLSVAAIAVLVFFGIMVSTYLFIRILVWRRHILFLMELILGQFLVTPRGIAEAYATLIRGTYD